MIPPDDTLSEDMLAYEISRKRRHMFELVMICSVCLTATLLSKWGTSHPIPVYSYFGTFGVFGYAFYGGTRAFGKARHLGVAGELAKSLPFCLVILYIMAWLGASEMLIGTKAFATPFTLHVAGFTTLVLILFAAYFTMKGPMVKGIDVAAGCAWFAILLPTLYTSDVRSSSTVMVLFRIVFMLVSVWCLNIRDEGRYSPMRWNTMTHFSAQQTISIAATMATFRLVQTAWIIHCFPPPLFLFMVLFIVMNEKRIGGYMHVPDYDHDGDEFPQAAQI